MSLFEELQHVKSEEDVKDAYIKALGLKSYTKGLIDIQTDEVWFEAKDTGKHSSYAMFTQLLHYVQVALNNGEHIPPLLAVIDTKKAALMKSTDVLSFLEKKTVKWGKSASKYTQEALDEISTHIGTHFVSYKIETHEDEFISTVKEAIETGEIVRAQITPSNLKQVFDKWIEMIGIEINDVDHNDYALLFFADIMHDGTVSTHKNLPAELLHKNDTPVFSLNGKLYELGNKEGYRQFWAIYEKPPKKEYRDYLLERRDSLIPLDERSFKGAYYTPLPVVDKAYNLLDKNLGGNWQRDYIVWDMCCGVGNLEVKHSNPRKIFMSTLDGADVDVMKATKTCVAAERFQYDYLNDDITGNGEIDYSITEKVPPALREAIAKNKKILILINPPYAEATNFDNIAMGLDAENKSGVAKTKVAQYCMDGYGKASKELFTQFLSRIAKEIPTATVATFSTLKYVNAPNFEEFREKWNAQYIDGFIVNSKLFEGLKGKFPIAFLLWKTDNRDKANKLLLDEISVDVFDIELKPIGAKRFYNLPKSTFLNVWLKRPRTNKEPVIPLKNGLSPTISKPRVKTWSDNAIAYMYCGVNDFQHAEQQTTIYSSVYHGGNGFYITPENLLQACIIFTARRIERPTWINDRDQFYQPNSILSDEFSNDCLIWTIFNRCQRTASTNELEWNDRKWSIVSHFIPYSEDEVNAPDRFESDFMVQFMSGREFSKEACKVLEEGKKLWQAYFSYTDVRSVRDEFKLDRSDVSWFQVRKALEKRNSSGDTTPVSFDDFERAYGTLSSKLKPIVYDYEFIRA